MRPTARLLLLNRPEDRYCCVIVLLLAVLCSDSGVFARCPVMLNLTPVVDVPGLEGGSVVIRRLEFRCMFKA